VTMSVGFVALIPLMSSLVIIHNKFNREDVLQNEDFSNCLVPLIFAIGVYLCFVLASLHALVRDGLAQNMPVWIRNSIGSLLQQIIALISILVGLVKMRRYILLQEQRAWQADEEGDISTNFYIAFRPALILLGLYFVKSFLFQEEYQFWKCMIAKSLVGLCILVSTYFDSRIGHAVSLWLLALPITSILCG